MFRSSNPTLKPEIMTGQFLAAGSTPMTLRGTIGKAGVLLAITVAMSAVSWFLSQSSPATGLIVGVGGFILALITAITTCFKAQWAPVTAPLYAIFQGLFVGFISWFSADRLAGTQYAGAVPIAVLSTMIVFGVMFGLYATRIIRVTETFRSVVIGATLAIMVLYLGSFLISFAWPGIWNIPIYSSGIIGIGFSVFVIGIAALNLALDFDTIEQGVTHRAPKFMEWYAAFGLMVTLIWLYLEILNLMRKLAGAR